MEVSGVLRSHFLILCKYLLITLQDVYGSACGGSVSSPVMGLYGLIRAEGPEVLFVNQITQFACQMPLNVRGVQPCLLFVQRSTHTLLVDPAVDSCSAAASPAVPPGLPQWAIEGTARLPGHDDKGSVRAHHQFL